MTWNLHGLVAATHTPFDADCRLNLAGDLVSAREEQFRNVRLIQRLEGYGYLGAAKALMGMLGVPVGPARLTNGSLPSGGKTKPQDDLDHLGFFSWVRENR